MADIFIPKPKPETTAFVPTPDPVVPTTAAPITSTPSTGAAVPSQPQAAGTLGTPAPATATQPTPEKGVAQATQSAAPAVKIKPPEKSTTTDVQKPAATTTTVKQADGSSTTTKTPQAQKSATDAALESLAPFNAIVKGIAEGKDPIYQRELNNVINGIGPKNQAMLSGLSMKLAQENLDGQGAGKALIAMMARDAQSDENQIIAQLGIDSAKRLSDFTQWGVAKANEISKAQETQKRQDLATFISTGQTAAAKSTFEGLFPGVPFDEAAIKAADPTRIASFTSRMKVVDQFVAQGNAEMAKDAFTRLAKDMPEMFGFSTPEEAVAALSGIDFTSDAWQANLKASNDANSAARTAALQGDDAGLSAAIDMKFSKMTPAAVEAVAKSAAKRSLDEINAILDSAGMAPVSTQEEVAMLPKIEFAKAAEAFDLKKDAVKEAPDRLFDIFAKANPAMALDPEAARAAKAFLSSAAYNLATNPDGSTSLSAFTPGEGKVAPWDTDSPQANMFYDWPIANFNTGSTPDVLYEGLKPYDQNYKPGDLTTVKGKEDARLDKAYNDYVFSVSPEDRLDMKRWYYATSGGLTSPKTELLTGALTPSKKSEDFSSVGLPESGTASETKPGTGAAVAAAKAIVDSDLQNLPSTIDRGAISSEIDTLSANGYSARSVKDALYQDKANLPGYDSNVTLNLVAGGGGGKSLKVTPAAKDYFGFTNLIKQGLPAEKAAQVAIKVLGERRFKESYKALTGKDWS